jgi:hypothetical protein
MNVLATMRGWLLSLLQECARAEFDYPFVETQSKPKPQRYWKRLRA